jgi:hypothetical protein
LRLLFAATAFVALAVNVCRRLAASAVVDDGRAAAEEFAMLFYGLLFVAGWVVLEWSSSNSAPLHKRNRK